MTRFEFCLLTMKAILPLGFGVSSWIIFVPFERIKEFESRSMWRIFFVVLIILKRLIVSVVRTGWRCRQGPCHLWSAEPWIKVYSFVKVSEFYVTSLFFSLFVGEVREAFAGHPEEINELGVVRMVHKHFHKRLNKPGAMVVVPEGSVAGDGWVRNDHILPGRPGSGNISVVRKIWYPI